MKDIIGYEGIYGIEEDGRVWSVKRNMYMKPIIMSKSGYLRITLSPYGVNKKAFLVHRLIALHFIPNPKNLQEVDHIDRNRLNNKLDNLRWASHSENQINKNVGKNNKLGHKNIYIINQDGRLYHRIKITRDGITIVKICKTLEEAIEYRDSLISKT